MGLVRAEPHGASRQHLRRPAARGGPDVPAARLEQSKAMKRHLPTSDAPRRVLVAALWLLGLGGAAPLVAQGLDIFKDADLALGERLLEEHACDECHARRVGGDGRAIYRPAGRISTPGALRGMVDYCSTELKLGLFPEETTAIAAVLQRDHYKFK